MMIPKLEIFFKMMATNNRLVVDTTTSFQDLI